MAQIEGAHWWFKGRRTILESIIKHRVCPSEDARILEAGCGTGGNLQMLGTFGRVDAFEYDEDARRVARERSGRAIMAGSLPDGLGHIQGNFDLIALFDVLEHLDKDTESLQALAARLAPQGRIILSVPALPYLWSNHDEVHHHHRRYSKASLNRVLTQAGLNVEYISYFNMWLLPAAIVQRFLSRFSKSEPRLDGVPMKPLNALLTRVFESERVLLQKSTLPIGLSLCAICTLA